MDFLGMRGTKGFCVPDYFNFADVIDEWAQKEKVSRNVYREDNLVDTHWIASKRIIFLSLS